MRLRRPPPEYFFSPGRCPARRISRMSLVDLDAWLNAAMVALWQAVEQGHQEESREQMAIVNDLLVERCRREAAH